VSVFCLYSVTHRRELFLKKKGVRDVRAQITYFIMDENLEMRKKVKDLELNESLYFKAKNSYHPRNGVWWAYAKIIKHEYFDEETCQAFTFQKTSREHHFEVGNDFFKGFLDTNSYTYYCDMGEQITREEYERELKLFMEDLNNYISFINGSP